MIEGVVQLEAEGRSSRHARGGRSSRWAGVATKVVTRSTFHRGVVPGLTDGSTTSLTSSRGLEKDICD